MVGRTCSALQGAYPSINFAAGTGRQYYGKLDHYETSLFANEVLPRDARS